MDDLFNIKPEEPYIMHQKEFFDKTKKLLNAILNNYSKAYKHKSLKESEFPHEDICDKCQGCGLFKDEFGEEKECIKDYDDGWCHYTYIDYEELGIELETHLEDLFDLVSVNNIHD